MSLQRIFLEPVCPACNTVEDPAQGRLWCEDDVWGGTLCPGCSERLPDADAYELARPADREEER
jgi:hypothetical protein